MSNNNLPMITILTNTRCNQKCAYCPPMGESYSGTPGDLNAERAYTLVKEALDIGFSTFRFSGGEPLLHSNFTGLIKVMDLIKAHGGIIMLNTNGVLLNKYRDILTPSRIDVLRVSLDTLDKSKYKQITGTNSLTKVIKNIFDFKSDGHHVCVNMVVMKHNHLEIPSIIEFCKINRIELKLCDLEKHRYDEQGFWNAQYINISSLAHLIETMEIEKKIAIPVGDWGMHMIDFVADDIKIRIKDSLQSAVYGQFCKNKCLLFPCPEGIYSLLIKPDGNVTWCKRNDEQDPSHTHNLTFNSISSCKDTLKNIFRINHAKESLSTYSSNNTLLRKDIMTNTKNQPRQEAPTEWGFIGQQKKYGRDD